MSFISRFGEKLRGTGANANFDKLIDGEASEPALEEALANFRASVLAWSEAEFGRARVSAKTVRQRSWRLAAGWALGCVLVAGGVGSGIHEHQHKLELARIAAARAVEQQRAIAEQRAREEEDLLANVDSDVSREVPSALEPLAQLMTDDETKQADSGN